MKAASKLIAELADQILAKVVSYARKSDMTIENILVLEERLKGGIRLLNLQQQLKLVTRFVSNNFLRTIIKPDHQPNNKVEELCHNILLFNATSPIDTFLVSKFLVSFLLETEKEKAARSEEVGTKEAIVKDINENIKNYQSDYGDYYRSRRFGNRNKSRLKLSGNEVKLLNKVWIGDTVFTEIQQCADESAKLFLHLIKKLEEIFNKKGKDFLGTLDHLDKSQNQTNYYEYYSEWDTPVTNYVFNGVLKIAENAIRKHYRHTRKRDEDIYGFFEKTFKFNPKDYLITVIQVYQSKIERPALNTRIKLNELNTARWKEEFKIIKSNQKTHRPEEIAQHIHILLEENKKNTSIANIYFEATKLLVGNNRQETLKCYLHYYALKAKDKKARIKTLPQGISRKIFTKKEYSERFVKIISRLSQDGRLDLALEDVEKVFKTERKKIQIDEKEIIKINKTHKETVEQLNVILTENNDDETQAGALQNEEQHTLPAEKSLADIFDVAEVGNQEGNMEFDVVQLALLHKFKENEMTLTAEQVSGFAKEKRTLKGQLINKINEQFYEHFEEVLITNNEEGYEINADYFDVIKNL